MILQIWNIVLSTKFVGLYEKSTCVDLHSDGLC